MMSRPALILDTNVLVSGLLNPAGAPADVLRLVLAGHVRLAHDARIVAEYEAVLHRPRLRLDPALTAILLRGLTAEGVIVAGVPLRHRLPDRDDEPFLEVCLAAGPGAALLTGNLRHYPEPARAGAVVLGPREWLERWRQGKA